jgi:hypothetical protein|tara:strand:+ start:12384 stop:14258 length:1875 start_codon:yes stop_codon:yes gene_type:complete
MNPEVDHAKILSLLSGVSDKLTDRVLALEDAVSNTIGMSTNSIKAQPESIVQKAEPVIIADIGKEAKKDFREVLTTPESKEEAAGGEGDGGIMAYVKKLIGPALIILGSLGALVGGLFAGGGTGMQDTLQVIGKGGLALGLKLAAKTAGTLLKPVLGKLPLIGSLISFGFAYSAFKNDDFVGGLFDLASGLSGLLYFVPGGQAFAFPLQMGIDTLSAMLSLSTTQEEGETMGQAKSRTLKEFMGKIFEKMKNIFPLRNFISFGTGISEVLSGNFSSGISKMVTAFPIFDALNLINNLFLGGDGSVDDMASGMGEKISNIAGGAKAFVAALIEPIKDKFPMKNFIGIYEGVGKVFKGNFKEGLIQIGKNGMPVLAAIGEFFFGSTDAETGEKKDAGYKKVLGTLGGFFGPIKDKLLMKVLNILPEKILGVSVRNRVADLLGINLGAIEDDPEEAAANAEAERAQDMAKIERNIAEERARIKRSEAGENEYFGREGKGVENSQEKIAELEAKLAKRQDGGPVNRNTPYMVGEAGPELFIPKNNGDVVDNKTVNILENTLDRKTFVDITKMNIKISNQQMDELKKNNMLLQAILEKSNAGSTIIKNQSSSVVNNQSSSGFRDMQFNV